MRDRLGLLRQDNGFKVERRRLPIGDYLWVCRRRSGGNGAAGDGGGSGGGGSVVEELILGDCIVERKRCDDVRQSLHSGHLNEQFWRFGAVGVTDPILLIEQGGIAIDPTEVPKFEQLYANAQVHRRFSIYKTASEEDTVGFLLIKSNEYLRLVNHAYVRHECTRSFGDLEQAGKKSPTLSATDMLTRTLMQIQNITCPKAMEITKHYPTLLKLVEAVEDGTWLATPGIGNYAKKVIAELYSTDECT